MSDFESNWWRPRLERMFRLYGVASWTVWTDERVVGAHRVWSMTLDDGRMVEARLSEIMLRRDSEGGVYATMHEIENALAKATQRCVDHDDCVDNASLARACFANRHPSPRQSNERGGER